MRRVLMKLPASTPRLAIRRAMGLLGMRWREWEAKLLLYLAIQEQDEDGLARDVLDQQVRMDWPGLGEEVRRICKDVGLPDITHDAVRISKDAIKESIKYNNLKHLKSTMNEKEDNTD